MSKQSILWRFFFLAVVLAIGSVLYVGAANPCLPLLNEPVDISGDFRDFSNLYYLADRVIQFDPATATGKLCWRRAQYQTRQAFNNMLAVIRPVASNEFPDGEYEADPVLPFSIEFVSPLSRWISAKPLRSMDYTLPGKRGSTNITCIRFGTIRQLPT